MTRGDIVTVATGSGYGGKPRPALIIQSDVLAERGSLILLGFTSELQPEADWRPVVEPDTSNGLRERSVVMTDAPIVASRIKVGTRIGRLSDRDLGRVESGLMIVYGLA